MINEVLEAEKTQSAIEIDLDKENKVIENNNCMLKCLRL